MTSALDGEDVAVERIRHAALNATFHTLDNNVRGIAGGAVLTQRESRGIARRAIVMNVLNPSKVSQVAFSTREEESDGQRGRSHRPRSGATVMDESRLVRTVSILDEFEESRIDRG